jgi:hypothetical protein
MPAITPTAIINFGLFGTIGTIIAIILIAKWALN